LEKKHSYISCCWNSHPSFYRSPISSELETFKNPTGKKPDRSTNWISLLMPSLDDQTCSSWCCHLSQTRLISLNWLKNLTQKILDSETSMPIWATLKLSLQQRSLSLCCPGIDWLVRHYSYSFKRQSPVSAFLVLIQSWTHYTPWVSWFSNVSPYRISKDQSTPQV
jgi:hypothetical protein